MFTLNISFLGQNVGVVIWEKNYFGYLKALMFDINKYMFVGMQIPIMK